MRRPIFRFERGHQRSGSRRGRPKDLVLGQPPERARDYLLAALADAGGSTYRVARQEGVSRWWINVLVTRFGLGPDVVRMRADAKRIARERFSYGMDPNEER